MHLSPKICEAHASECKRRAATITADHTLKSLFLELGDGWRQLARLRRNLDAERRLQRPLETKGQTFRNVPTVTVKAAFATTTPHGATVLVLQMENGGFLSAKLDHRTLEAIRGALVAIEHMREPSRDPKLH